MPWGRLWSQGDWEGVRGLSSPEGSRADPVLSPHLALRAEGEGAACRWHGDNSR